jgi:DNA gyrase/topoisomerase IV subunit B
MQTQNPNSLILLMTQSNLNEFEDECLNELNHKQAKRIIKHLSGFLTDANQFAQNIIAQSEAAKAKEQLEKPKEETKSEDEPENQKLNGKKLTPVIEEKKA